MGFIKIVLRRPVTVALLVLSIIVFGINSLLKMPLEYMPDMEMPMELVIITWPGADADSIERLVTEAVEEECETQSDVSTVNSYTSDNMAMVQVQYNYGVDLEDAYSDLKTALDLLATTFPEGCEDPIILEISANAIPTMTLSASSQDGSDIFGYLEETVTPALQSIGGVAQVEITGAQDEYLRIILDESKLEQYGLTISSVASAITSADFDMPVGTVTVGSQDVALSAFGDVELGTVDIRKVPIQTSSGQIIRLEDVVSFMNLYQEDAESLSRFNGTESALLSVTKQNSAPTLAVCSGVEEVLEELSDNSGVEFLTIYSESDSIMEVLAEVVRTLAMGVLLTMAVLLLFFGRLKASLIVGCSMPLSILISIICLSVLGFNFDMMTGTSLIIAIGMIVDNSIVILESCMRAREKGLDFHEAAVQGGGEVLLSVFAGTITTVVVYIPLALSGGMVGQASSPLSWTIALTMLSSFLCAVTVVPLMFYLVKPTPREDMPINKLLARFSRFYRRVTPGLLRRPGRVVAFSAVLLLGAGAIALQMDFVLFPNNFDGSVRIETTFRSGTKLEVMNQEIQELETALLSDENFDSVMMTLSGSTATFTAYAAEGNTRSSEEAVEEYTTRFGSAAGMDVTVTPTGAVDMSAIMGSTTSVDVTLLADDLGNLEDGTAMLEEAIYQVPGVMKVNNPFSENRLQGRLVIDAQKAVAAGTTQAAVAMQVNYFLNGLTAATIEYGDQEYDVVLEYPEGRYDDLIALMSRPITTPTGSKIVLSDIAEIEYENALPTITRQDGQFVVNLSAVVTESAKFEAEKSIDAIAADMAFPPGVGTGMTAMDKTTAEETESMVETMFIGIFLVFLVMALQFNSPRLSLMVMLCIPFSLIGSFGLVFLTGRPMSILGVMGFLMLFGIVVNNGILLVDTTNQLRQSLPLEEALIQAGITRLRPILMTTLTTILSILPMTFSTDSNMSMMKDMGFIIIGGLIASTILTLFLMPSFYLLIRRERPDGTKRGKPRKVLATAGTGGPQE